MPGYDHDFSVFDKLSPYDHGPRSNVQSGFSGKTPFSILRDGKTIFEYERLYGQYGRYAYQAFRSRDRHYALVGTEYNDAKIIDLASGGIASRLDKSDKGTGGHFCPTGFYIPAVAVDPTPYYHRKEYEAQTYNPETKEYGKKLIPAHDCFMTTPDFELGDPELTDKDFAASFDTITFLDTAFMCGVWWAADYEWMVYRFSLAEAISTGSFKPEKYCFAFDYGAKPEPRQYLKTTSLNATSLYPFQAEHSSFEFYCVRNSEDW